MNSTSTPFEPHDSRDTDTTKAVLWSLLSAVCLYALLLYGVDTSDQFESLLHLIRPITTTAAVGVIAISAMKIQHPRRKRAWQIQCATVGGGVLFNLIYLFGGVGVASPLLQLLALVVYGSAILGTGLYLRTIAELVGNSLRVIFGAITVGCAFLIWANITIPIFSFLPLGSEAQAVLSFLAYDVGTIFAIITVASRHSYPPRSLVCVLVCMVFLLVADLLTFANLWFAWADPLLSGPLYASHSIFLAGAAYYDTKETYKPQDAASSSLSFKQWVLWTVIPLGSVLSALSVAAIIGHVSPILVVLLVLVAILHEAIAVKDYRRVMLALHKARLDSADLAAERERNTIAREIHDGLSHYFTGIGSQLQAAQVLLNVNRERAVGALGKAQHLAAEGLDEVRRSMTALRENPLSTRSLSEAIEVLLDNGKSATLKVQLDVCGTARPLHADVALTLYRIAQEAITNTLKYAEAQSIHVTLDYQPAHHTVLTIRDDGQGAENIEGGFGLIGMRERVEILGGRMHVDTMPGQGFTINVEVPA